MTPYEFFSVAIGASCGAWIRWGLSILLNSFVPTLPLGTLLANLTGALLIGILVTAFDHNRSLDPAVRALFVTGFLGALTTFSSFSAESINLLTNRKYYWFIGHILAHLGGSLCLTLVAVMVMRAILREPLMTLED